MEYTILVVEDDTAMAGMLEATLSSKFDIVVCTEKAHAISRAKAYLSEKVPDAIVIDLIINGEGGLDLYKWMQEHDIYAPVIFLTGCHQQSPEYVAAQETGERVYDKDSFSSTKLAAILSKMVGRKAS
jgi:DNA-binding NtrC family response regulator